MTTNRSPLVTFIVPCFNYARYVSECLESILNQDDVRDFEVIVIDDASTDHTPDVLARFTDPRMRVSRHAANRGHVFTINEGLTAARGRFVARIDPDDRYRPDFLTATLPKFDTFPDVDVVYGDVALIDETGRITVERCDREHGGRDFKGNELVRLLERNFICAPTVIARREAWLRALPAPEGLAFNDWYFTVMMAQRSDFYYVDRVLADYRVHGQNHHAKIAQNRTEEPSIFWLLDHVFAEREIRPDLDEAKVRARRRIYAAQYLTLADKYFGYGLNADARRCYLAAIRRRPDFLRRPDVVRHALAASLSRSLYERTKAIVKHFKRVPASQPGHVAD